MRGRLATIVTTFGAAALVMSTMGEATPAYIWNASNSVPIGLYRLQPAGSLAVTELVAVRPPEPLATFLDLNGYLPIGVPMLKRVLALPGQTVCRKGVTISVDAIDMGEAFSRDSRGRPLPGCFFGDWNPGAGGSGRGRRSFLEVGHESPSRSAMAGGSSGHRPSRRRGPLARRH